MLLEIRSRYPEPRKIQKAVDALREDAVVGVPCRSGYYLCARLGYQSASVALASLLGSSRKEQRKAVFTLLARDLRQLSTYAALDKEVFRYLTKGDSNVHRHLFFARQVYPRRLRFRNSGVVACLVEDDVPGAVIDALGEPLVGVRAETTRWRGIENREKDISLKLDTGEEPDKASQLLDLRDGVSVEPVEVSV